MRLVVSSDAQQEMDDDADVYEREYPGRGADFLDELAEAFQLLRHQPAAGRFVELEADLNLHEFVLRRFPYCVVYDINGSDLTVVAIAHQSRQEQYWRNRVQETAAVYAIAA